MPRLQFKSGERIFLPGGSGTCRSVASELLRTADVRITTSFVPGVNTVVPSDIGPRTLVSGFFMFPSLSDCHRLGTYRHLPMSYSTITRWLGEQRPFDTCVVQISRPRADGRASLGPAAEFTPSVLERARRIIAVVNHRVPFVENAPSLAWRKSIETIETDEPLISYGAGQIDGVSARVAGQAASFIKDGVVLQLGIGKVPSALSSLLCDRRGLRLHSGMLSDGVMQLAKSGSLDPDWPHLTTMFLGSEKLYEWIAGHTGIRLSGCEQTHDPRRLAALERFVAVNSALSVDLFGQCNLETASGRALSGSGGAPDFARAAHLSPGGISIVALPSTTGPSQVSRIVSTLGRAGIVTLSRTEADIVVTDEGVADLRGLSVAERADALIAVAHPDARPRLSEEWREIADKL